MNRNIIVDGEIIEYNYQYKRIKRINLRINSDAEVTVSAPKLVKLEQLDEFVAANAEWIKKKKKLIAKQNTKLEGEDLLWIYHLGKKYPIAIEKAQKTDIHLNSEKLLLKIPIPIEKLDVEATVKAWRKFSAYYVCDAILKRLYPVISPYINHYPNLRIRTTKSRWGSYSKRTNSIMINSELVKYPMECVEYVIMHELCHLKYLDHSSKFYDLLSIVMPDYKEREKKLKEFK